MLGSVEFDYTGPDVVNVTLIGGVDHDAQTWVDSPSIELSLSATDNVGVDDVNIEGDVVTPGALDYANNVFVELTVGDGPKLVTIIFTDTVGNSSAITTLLIDLEQTVPANPIPK